MTYRVEATIVLTDGSTGNAIMSDVIESRDVADDRAEIKAASFSDRINEGSICVQIYGNKWSVIPAHSIRSITVYVVQIFEELYDD